MQNTGCDSNQKKVDPFSNEEFEVDGDLAYHRYSFGWTLMPKSGGDTISQRGADLHIFKRKPDGSWVFLKDIWRPDTTFVVGKR